MGKVREVLGISEITEKKGNLIWRALLAEFLGNLLLNFFGCGSVVSLAGVPNSFVLIALTFGFTIFIVVQNSKMGKVREVLGISEITEKKGNLIWRALLAEFLGNLLLNFFGCGSVVSLAGVPNSFVLIALTFGFTIFIVVQALGHVSGAHVNPAVTCGMLVTGNIPVIKGLLYIIAQCIGALAGSAILKALTPEEFHAGGLGNTAVNAKLNVAQACGIEFFLGFVLVLTVFGVCDVNRPESKPAGALAIGLSVALGHMAAIDYTGSSMNPARSFGSALIAAHWDDHWVYWAGPILGGIAAALMYKHAFSAPPPGPITIVERYGAVGADEKELKPLDSGKKDKA